LVFARLLPADRCHEGADTLSVVSAARDTVPVLIASPLEEELASRVAALDPAVELLYEPDLLPPARWVGDIAGDSSFRRDQEGERRFSDLLGRAEVLYGIPGRSGEALADALRRGPGIRWVQARNAGAGEQVADALRLAPAEVQRVTVTTSAGVHAGPLAEFCMLGLLAFVKDLPRLERNRAERRWPGHDTPGRELRGQTLLLLGLGGVGREIARLAKSFGMAVLGVRRNPSQDVAGVDEVHSPDQLPALAARSNHLAVTLPLTEATRHLVDAEILDALPSDAVVVNVGRGGVVDEPALIERLSAGSLAGAALDVVEREPLPEDSPLWVLPNVIISPHDAALVPAEPERVMELFLDNLRRHLEGEPLRNRVDLDALY
jgi:phosphoglycerate dehydrogenase-like enzyme